ncbi:MAG: regulatory protein RecX [Proteobacteria bacterium]|nr:regulatory protein RecX [Pseudomonadota bacterium]
MENSIASVRQKILELQARREHSQAEIREKLKLKGFELDFIDQAIQEFLVKRLIRDDRFCEMYVRQRVRRGYGPVRISAELQQRGVSEDLIHDALSQSELDWETQVTEVRAKKFGNQLPKDEMLRIKQIRFLQYRGFTLEQIRKLF